MQRLGSKTSVMQWVPVGEADLMLLMHRYLQYVKMSLGMTQLFGPQTEWMMVTIGQEVKTCQKLQCFADFCQQC